MFSSTDLGVSSNDWVSSPKTNVEQGFVSMAFIHELVDPKTTSNIL